MEPQPKATPRVRVVWGLEHWNRGQQDRDIYKPVVSWRRGEVTSKRAHAHPLPKSMACTTETGWCVQLSPFWRAQCRLYSKT